MSGGLSSSSLAALTHYLADAIGRRPVILAGLSFVIMSTLAFGLSKSLAMVLITRCLGMALSFSQHSGGFS